MPLSTKGRLTKLQMVNHVESLCLKHKISIDSHSSGGRACKRLRQIAIRPVKSEITYAIALHEIGHVVGPMQSQPRLFSEAGAWAWAKDNAGVWTPRMVAKCAESLDSYAEWAFEKHRRKVRNAPVVPPANHVFWELCSVEWRAT